MGRKIFSKRLVVLWLVSADKSAEVIQRTSLSANDNDRRLTWRRSPPARRAVLSGKFEVLPAGCGISRSCPR